MDKVDEMQRDACISDCGRYRYTLHRRWAYGKTVVFCGLNPSTADASKDDPTVRKEVAYAKEWGFGTYCKVNVYALRSTDPKALWLADDPGAHAHARAAGPGRHESRAGREGVRVKAARKANQQATAVPAAPPAPATRSDVTVHGFGFEFTDLVWDSRAMQSVPHYLCRELQAGLVDHGPYWTCRICSTGATGDSAEEAFAAAYRALDTRVDRLTQILNLIHERSGLT